MTFRRCVHRFELPLDRANQVLHQNLLPLIEVAVGHEPHETGEGDCGSKEHHHRDTPRIRLTREKQKPDQPERIEGTYDVYEYFDEKREALERWSQYLDGLSARS